jgi:hypothetical protein
MDLLGLPGGIVTRAGASSTSQGFSGVDQGRVDNTFQRLTRCSDGMPKNPVRRNARR